VCGDLSIAVERGYLNSGNEWESSRAMDLDGNGCTSISQQRVANCASSGFRTHPETEAVWRNGDAR
jgi:hypothetical protein